jgi:2-amino-4-hydroxy-6-hydroxymethyldihydropteridine diphosphokinase
VSNPWWTPAYVGLGSNLDDPPLQLARGFEALAKLPDTRLVLRSRLYRTRPLGPIDQADFVNAAAGLLTRLPCRGLLESLKNLEGQLGRQRPVERWGPRLIDLDLLVYGNARVDEPGLTVPHPGIAERAFVLAPLADIAADLRVPGLGLVRDLLSVVDTSGLLGAAS